MSKMLIALIYEVQALKDTNRLLNEMTNSLMGRTVEVVTVDDLGPEDLKNDTKYPNG